MVRGLCYCSLYVLLPLPHLCSTNPLCVHLLCIKVHALPFSVLDLCVFLVLSVPSFPSFTWCSCAFEFAYWFGLSILLVAPCLLKLCEFCLIFNINIPLTGYVVEN